MPIGGETVKFGNERRTQWSSPSPLLRPLLLYFLTATLLIKEKLTLPFISNMVATASVKNSRLADASDSNSPDNQHRRKQKPLKKRSLRSDSIFSPSPDNLNLSPPKKLKRQVASCWRYGQIDEATHQLYDWGIVVSKLPPTSGSYEYEEHDGSVPEPADYEKMLDVLAGPQLRTSPAMEYDIESSYEIEALTTSRAGYATGAPIHPLSDVVNQATVTPSPFPRIDTCTPVDRLELPRFSQLPSNPHSIQTSTATTTTPYAVPFATPLTSKASMHRPIPSKTAMKPRSFAYYRNVVASNTNQQHAYTMPSTLSPPVCPSYSPMKSLASVEDARESK
jgi:hypothetical protein